MGATQECAGSIAINLALRCSRKAVSVALASLVYFYTVRNFCPYTFSNLQTAQKVLLG